MAAVRFRVTFIVTVASIVLIESGAAHVTPVPTFVNSGERQTLTLVVPNEREVRMNGLTVDAPEGVSILEVPPSDDGWPGTVEGATASWDGCCVAAGAVGSFSLALVASGEPRSVTLEAVQRYPDGETTRWPVQLAVLPAPKESGSLTTVLAVAGLGLLVTVGVVGFAWFRRSRPLQEG
jgi:hypothetical protein